jgi:replicative DNA helicase
VSSELVTQQIEAEKRVLAAWFADPRFRAAWVPDPGLFSSPGHRALAEVCSERPGATDTAAVLELRRRDKLKLFEGGAEGVVTLLEGTPWVADPWAEVGRLRELNGLRALRDGVQSALTAVREGQGLDAVQGLVSEALRASSAACGSNVLTVQGVLDLARVQAVRPDEGDGCVTGTRELDGATGGIRPGYVWVFGADTSYGKSSWLLHVADLNLQRGRRVLVVSGEDPPELYGRRLLARRARMNAWALRDRRLSVGQHRDLTRVVQEAETTPFFLDGRGIAAERLASGIRALVLGEGIELVLVDYLQCFRVATKLQDRRTEVAHVARTFTDAIKATGAGGVLFSQITVDTNKKTPDKHSIRESRDVSNAAEVVLLGYEERPEEELDHLGHKTGKEVRRKMLFLDKNKDGERGLRVEVAWNNVWAGFEPDADYTSEEPEAAE